MPGLRRPSSRALALVALAVLLLGVVAGSVYLIRSRNPSAPPAIAGSSTTSSAVPGSTVPAGGNRTITPVTTTALDGWLISSQNLTQLMNADPGLTAQVFDNNRTVVLTANSTDDVPSGWRSIAGRHYTSLSECTSDCQAFASQSSASSTPQSPVVALYDDENWARTPASEQQHPCSSMAQFVGTATRGNLSTIVAPDQDLADPGVITSYQGGETQNWQTYLRLGLAGCGAASGATGLHIMSQAFESRWCGNQAGGCQGSESDFVNYVTQSALQARAQNPSIHLTIGLGANPKYNVTSEDMYQDASDVNDLVQGSWMNLVGRQSVSLTIPFLQDIVDAAPVTPHTSVLFAGGGGSLGASQPETGQPIMFNLAQAGATETFVSSSTVPGGTVLPAGAYEFQYWTGSGRGSATLGVSFGYCVDPACSQRNSVSGSGQSWDAAVGPNAHGAASSGGALTTTSSTRLPAGGPYRLFWSLRVLSPGSFNLEYGSGAAATNLATPILFDRNTDGSLAVATTANSATPAPAGASPSTPVAPTPIPFHRHRRRLFP